MVSIERINLPMPYMSLGCGRADSHAMSPSFACAGALPSTSRLRSPILWRHIRDVLRERPPVTSVVLSGILPLTPRLVRWCLQNPRPMSLRLFAMFVDILNRDVHVLIDPIAWGRKRSSTQTNHNRTLTNRKLSVANPPIWSRCAKSLPFLPISVRHGVLQQLECWGEEVTGS